ncbi:MAG: DUF4173 domain-containing protein [Oscillospiraceae bacterium]|nr:DUF4173 domain-containing protein [Oscillospiraceae bacterium]
MDENKNTAEEAADMDQIDTLNDGRGSGLPTHSVESAPLVAGSGASRTPPPTDSPARHSERPEGLASRRSEESVLPPPAFSSGQWTYSPQPAYPKRRSQGRDLVLAGALLVFCFLLWDSFIWAKGLGLGEALGLAGLLPAALIYLKKRDSRMTLYGWICAGLYLLGALSLVFSGDGVLKLLTLCALVPLFLIVILERLGLRTGTGLPRRLSDLLYACFMMTLGRMGAGAWALTHCGEADSTRSKRTGAALLGVVCAVPILLIVVPLLISSDAAFAGLVGKLDWSAGRDGLIALGFGGFTALLLFTLLFTSDKGPKPQPETARKGCEPAAIAAFLGIIGAVYVLYLVAQFAYFTDAFRGLLPKGFTVAEYARRGFFEMCAIVAINLFLIVLALGICRKEGGKVPGSVKGLALFLCLFSLILVATALSKMVLYMGSFGLTRLRLTTSVFMIFLGLVVLAEGLRLFVGKLPVVQFAVTLGAVILIGLSAANVDHVVARYNVDAWRSGKLDSLDAEMICELGDGAVPVLAELAEGNYDSVSETARRELRRRSPETDLRSWNTVTQAANEVLEAFR